MAFDYKKVLLTLSAVLALSLVAASLFARQKQLPNILVIITDDQGLHDVGYYGTKDLVTPNIDQLTGEGLRFNNFYANSSVCSPTRAALLSGRYPGRVGVPGVIRTHETNNWGFLSPGTILLPQLLKGRGYSTAVIGKWHLGLGSPNTPNEHGVDYFHGWLGDMMDDYIHKRRHDINYMRKNNEVIDPPGHATDLFTEWAVSYINEQAGDQSPFFLYLGYNAPHFPVQPPQSWVDRVKKRVPGITEKRAKLVAFIEHLDDGIGKVIEALRKSGQYDNTVIVFTSDNGGWLPDEANNGPYRDGKGTMYEGGLRIPTAVIWKDHIAAGSVTDYRAISMDLYPTLAGIAGAEINHEIDGVSILPVLLGEKQADNNRPLFYERREGGDNFGGLPIQAVSLDGWKLLQNSPFQKQELYHLAEDPYETSNLIESHPEKYKELNALLRQHIQKAGRVPWQK